MNKAILASMLMVAMILGATTAIFLYRSTPKQTAALPVVKDPVAKPAPELKEFPRVVDNRDIAPEAKQTLPLPAAPLPPAAVEAPPPQVVPPAPPPALNPPKPNAPPPDQAQPARPRRNQAPGTVPDAPAAQQVIPNDTAREALSYVGADPAAEAVWYEAINDPNTSKKAREDLIEDLNEEGFADPKNITIDDLPLIMSRLSIIEQLAPDSMDETNYAAFMEAYKDLTNMFNKLVK